MTGKDEYRFGDVTHAVVGGATRGGVRATSTLLHTFVEKTGIKM
jgi:hypothetical protein